MKTSIKILHWTPRIICILAILFISVFAIDAFGPEKTFWQQLGDFLLHLVPSFVLIAVLIVAWKWEYIGGIIFIIIGFGLSIFVFILNYNRTHSVGTSLGEILIITFPFVVVGILFIISYFMKKGKVNQNFNIKSMGIILVLIFAGIISCTGQKTDEKVYEAYELRINGHADSAKVLLQQITTENPTNAMAWYELCRTTEHLGMANPRAIKESLDEALRCISLAVENDPKNAWYLSYKGGIETLQFYLALQIGNENASAYLAKLEDTYKSVFELDPSYYENKLTLVEFFGGLPTEIGGDTEKAEKYAKELESEDLIYSAKAREILMPEDANYETFWKEIVEKNNKNADAHQALGRVYLFMDNIDEATNCYQKAIDLDPSKNDLYLDLGRYYMMMAMQNPALTDSVSPFIEEQFNKFLNFSPKPIKPMRAWAYSILSMINSNTQNVEAADKFLTMAKDLDPFFSPISGKPSIVLYCQPDVVVHNQGYYLSPF